MASQDLSCLDHQPLWSDYERVFRFDSQRHLAVPFSASSPLVFHVLTGLPEHRTGDAALMDLIAGGTELVPPAESEHGTNLLLPRDAAAGDDRYLFLSALNTFRLKLAGEPALAFDAGALWDASEDGFAFRVHDLEPVYKQLTEQVEHYGDDVPEDWEEWSDEERERYMEEEAAGTWASELEWAAELGTQTDPEQAWALFDLHIRQAAGDLTPKQAWAKAKKLLPALDIDEGELGAEEMASIPEDWRDLFLEAPTSLQDAVWGVSMGKSPEILYPAPLPLCCATFWRDHRGVWAPIPPEICAAGRAARGLR